ncbi:MAG: SpoIIE family protein phosphatase [Planctomycetes bacterium]|nr:SpoIIE family protein phosphatase [Planctomycetota bacterium]
MTAKGGPSPGIEDLVESLSLCADRAEFYRRLEVVLGHLHALPAILYLRTGDLLHAVAGFECSSDVPPVPIDTLPRGGDQPGELPANQFPLIAGDETIGLIAVFGRAPGDAQAVHRYGVIVGATLRHLERSEALARELQAAQEQIGHLVGAGLLLHHLEIDVLLVKTLESVLGAVRAQVGAVMITATDAAAARSATWGLREAAVQSLRYRNGQRLIDRVLAEQATLAFTREELRESLITEGPMVHLGGLLAVPLTARGRSLGLVLLGNIHAFTPGQRRLAETLAGFAAIALDNAVLVKAMVDNERLTQELSIARSVQEGMYPLTGLAVGGVSVEGSSRPCNETGGDYFTFLEREGEVIAMVGDVSGHGLGAALFATMAHAIVQQQLHADADIAGAFHVLNEGLCHAQSGRFMTAALVALDPTTRAFSFVSAGQTPLLWIHDGEVQWLDSGGMPLGIVLDNVLVEDPPRRLSAGDVLVLYTDGFIEASNPGGEAFGDARLAATALEGVALGLGPTELMMLINSAVDAWCSGRIHEDDLTMVVIAVAG